MQVYGKMLRRLISHPKYGLELARKFQNNHIFKGKRCCFKCGSLGKQHKHKISKNGVITYKCNHCNSTYSEFYGTIFHKTKIPVNKWMIAILESCISTGSVSA